MIFTLEVAFVSCIVALAHAFSCITVLLDITVRESKEVIPAVRAGSEVGGSRYRRSMASTEKSVAQT